MELRLSLAALALVIACGPRPLPPSSVQVVLPESAVYAALLDAVQWRQSPDTLLVGDSTLSFRAPTGPVSAWRAQFDSIPAALPAALERLSQRKRPSGSLSLSRPIRVVTTTELRDIFSRGVMEGWMEFSRRFPGQHNYLTFTPVAFSSDSLDALVYYENHCGPLCGGGNAVWLTRRGDTRWRVRKTVTFWIS